MSDKPELAVTPEVVAEIEPTDDVEKLIAEIANKEIYAHWVKYHCGSGYYVELPHYLNGLLQAGEIGAARAVIDRAFNGEGGIPSVDFQRMVKYRLESELIYD